MRWVICALAIVTLAPRALADDFDYLRGAEPVGPATYANWSGIYLGGQFGVGGARADFSSATQTPIGYLLRETTLQQTFAPSEWPVLGTGTDTHGAFGGFVGYNSQWQDLILGIEGNYNQATLGVSAPSVPISRITSTDSTGNYYLVNLNATGQLSDLDFGTLRARAGYILNNFLPYGFVGVALGVADINVTSSITGETNPPKSGPCLATSTPSCSPFAFSASSGRDSQVLVGFTAGLGLDVAVTRNIFLRGEYEFVQFAPVSGVQISVNSARVGAGFRF
jgi:outer membrane immunogenic protein